LTLDRKAIDNPKHFYVFFDTEFGRDLPRQSLALPSWMVSATIDAKALHFSLGWFGWFQLRLMVFDAKALHFSQWPTVSATIRVHIVS
jgi:hypothetical protein